MKNNFFDSEKTSMSVTYTSFLFVLLIVSVACMLLKDHSYIPEIIFYALQIYAVCFWIYALFFVCPKSDILRGICKSVSIFQDNKLCHKHPNSLKPTFLDKIIMMSFAVSALFIVKFLNS